MVPELKIDRRSSLHDQNKLTLEYVIVKYKVDIESYIYIYIYILKIDILLKIQKEISQMGKELQTSSRNCKD